MGSDRCNCKRSAVTVIHGQIRRQGHILTLVGRPLEVCFVPIISFIMCLSIYHAVEGPLNLEIVAS